MSLATPPRFALTAHKAGHLALASDQGDTAHVFALENDIIRVLVLPDGRLNQPRTFAIAPGAEDVAQEGRDRFDGFTQPEFTLESNTESLRIETAAVRLTIRLAGFSVRGRCDQEPSGDRRRATGRPKPIILDVGRARLSLPAPGTWREIFRARGARG